MSRGRLVVVSGTGTGIGKTHVSEALLAIFGKRYALVSGVKPIETGSGEGNLSDASRLSRASTFHVQHFGYAFAEAVSPHLASRDNDIPIRIDVLVRFIQRAQVEPDVLLVELPGGLFTPLSDDEVNADLVRALAPDATLLVAADRLGCLHDVLSAYRAAAAAGVTIHGAILVAPEQADTSTGRNAAELMRILVGLAVAAVPRASAEDLAAGADLAEFVARLGWS